MVSLLDARRRQGAGSRARAQGAAALHHLRQRRRRQVDADRSAALRCKQSSTTSSPRWRATASSTARAGRARFRSAGRRPFRGARAGHHHRRRLSLLRDREAQVHRRRYARPRAVHPQHGHRRVDGGPCGDPGRRTQGRADPDPPPFLFRQAARHPAFVLAVNEDGPGRLRPGRVRRDRADYRGSPASALRTGLRSQCRGSTATTSSAAATHRRGIRGQVCWSISIPVDLTADADAAKPMRMPVQWVNRPDQRFRGFAGQIAAGRVRPGDKVRRASLRPEDDHLACRQRSTAILMRQSPASRSR